MARMKFLFASILGVTLSVGACAPSPLYVDRAHVGTYGEVPRDGRGEPIWADIRPAPPPVPPYSALPPPVPGIVDPA